MLVLQGIYCVPWGVWIGIASIAGPGIAEAFPPAKLLAQGLTGLVILKWVIGVAPGLCLIVLVLLAEPFGFLPAHFLSSTERGQNGERLQFLHLCPFRPLLRPPVGA